MHFMSLLFHKLLIEPCLKAMVLGKALGILLVDALTVKPTGGVKLNPDLCVGCGACVDACILGAVQWNKEEEKPLICIQCGLCAKYCPHDVLELVKD